MSRMLKTLLKPSVVKYCWCLAEGAGNGLQFIIIRNFNWTVSKMDFIPGIDGPGEDVLGHENFKVVDGDESQRTFGYIKDAIETTLMIIDNLGTINVPYHSI
uniref:Uncharacterized protein n=1 Tax=Lactuca sativa TaxID=4236 RepID=A0A9R1UXX1_LACSA|nr:hypothetical protein LSAT_V11C700349890 [Lactuca sativa]